MGEWIFSRTRFGAREGWVTCDAAKVGRLGSWARTTKGLWATREPEDLLVPGVGGFVICFTPRNLHSDNRPPCRPDVQTGLTTPSLP